MSYKRIVANLVVGLFIVALPGTAVGQDHATPHDVVAKVREAAAALSKSGDVAQFNQRQGPWVWKDTYIFVFDCDKKLRVAYPLKPETTGGTPLTEIKDTTGKVLYQDPQAFCSKAMKPSGTWVEYWWPKPGEKQGSRKVSYLLNAKGTPYLVGAGVYDDKASIGQLSKLSSKD